MRDTAVIDSSPRRQIRSVEPTVRRAEAPSLPRRAAGMLLPTAMLLALLLPTELSVNLGSLRFTAYRALLVVASVPCAIRVLTISRRLPDVLLACFALWIPLVLTYHHGVDTGLETGGIQSLELVGAYFVARASVRDLAGFGRVAFIIVWSVIALLPFVVYESVTGDHLLKDLAASIGGGSTIGGLIDQRYGFTRAFGTFDHPILLGVYAASALSMAWLLPWKQRWSPMAALPLVVGCGVCALGSLSSGAIATIMAQTLVLGWDRISRGVRGRWWILAGIAVAGYVLVDALSNRSGLTVLISYLTFDQNTAYGRTIIWEFGFWENAVKNPILGIGLKDWVRPVWITSPSVDNHWLLMTMVYGFPGVLMLAGAVFWSLRRAVLLARRSDDLGRRAAKAWAFSLFGISIAAATVAFWNSSLVYFSFLVGCWGAFASRSGGLPVQPMRKGP